MVVVEHEYRPELIGTERVVTDVQGNGYYFNLEKSSPDPDGCRNKRMWSGYAKASCYSFPAPDTFRHDEGAQCSCGAWPHGAQHREKCNVITGKRFAWTIRIMSLSAQND